MQVSGCYPPGCSSFRRTLRLASISAASTAACAFSRRRWRTAYSGLVSQWWASVFRAASSPARPERSRAVSLVTSFGSWGPTPLPPQHPTPPPAPCGLLKLYSSRPGLYPLWLLLDRLRRISRRSEGVQFSTEVVALPFGLFAPALFFPHPLAQRTLSPFAASTFGVELFAELSQLGGRAGALTGLSRL
jgi:hypothetical protein